jgi:hypothetical protein
VSRPAMSRHKSTSRSASIGLLVASMTFVAWDCSNPSGSDTASASSSEKASSSQSSLASANPDSCPTLGPCCNQFTGPDANPLSSDGVQNRTQASECAATAASGNADLCTMILTVLQVPESTPNIVCGVSVAPGQSYGTGASNPACLELAACCSSITEAGGTAACDFISYDDFSWLCASALQHFQAVGSCKNPHDSGL